MESGLDTIISALFLHFLVLFDRPFCLDFLHISTQSYPHRPEDFSRKRLQLCVLLEQDTVRPVLRKNGRPPILMIEPNLDRSSTVVNLIIPQFAPNQMRRMKDQNAQEHLR